MVERREVVQSRLEERYQRPGKEPCPCLSTKEHTGLTLRRKRVPLPKAGRVSNHTDHRRGQVGNKYTEIKVKGKPPSSIPFIIPQTLPYK